MYGALNSRFSLSSLRVFVHLNLVKLNTTHYLTRIVCFCVVLCVCVSGPPAVELFDDWSLLGSILGAGLIPWASAAIV